MACTHDNPHLWGSKPDVSDVVRDGFRGRHGAGQLPSLDDGCTALLHSLGEGTETVLPKHDSKIPIRATTLPPP